MAFHIDTFDLPPLRCYGDALAYWNRIKPWRGDADTNSRPIAGRKKRHMTIRKLNDESIAMRLWNTDVVTYHKDGSITLRAYQSTSTDSFARCLTPYDMGVNWNSEMGFMLHLTRGNLTHTFLQSGSWITLRRNDNYEWEPTAANMLRPFKKYSVNVAKANAVVKEHRFNDFCTWLKAVKAMGQKFNDNAWGRRDTLSPAQVAELLKQGGEGWMTVAEAANGDPDAVRQALYVHFQCVDQIEIPYVVGCDTANIRASNNRWRRLVNQYRGG